MREIFRRYTEEQVLDRRARPMADRAGDPDPQGQAGVGPLDGVGDAAQPRLPRPGRLRQDEGRRPARQADAHDPRPRRAPRPPAGTRRRAGRAVDCSSRSRRSITDETFALAQERLARNAHFAKRNTREPGPLQGLVVCRECGYACYRTSTRTTKRKDRLLPLHRPGQLAPRRRARLQQPPDPRRRARTARLGRGPPAARRPRRSSAPRSTVASPRCGPSTPPPAAAKRSSATSPAPSAAIERLIEAYQEQLISLDELRARMPTLRKRQSTLQAQLDTLDSRAARRRDLPQARRHARRLPHPPQRRSRPAHPRRTTAHPAPRRPRSPRRRRRRQDHDPPLHPHPERRPQRKLPIAWEQSPKPLAEHLPRTPSTPPPRRPPRPAISGSAAGPSCPRSGAPRTLKPPMVEAGEVVAEIRVEHPVHAPRHDPGGQRVKRIMRLAPRSEPIREPEEVLLVDRVQHLHHRPLQDLVLQRGCDARSHADERTRR